MVTEINYPEYAFTYETTRLDFASGTIEVKYIPTDVRFTTFSFMLPVLPTFDPDNMAEYVKRWAPHDKWFAQEQMLIHADKIVKS